ncbi:MAG TPA: twitch domain-containing radical SAM protein, partial [Thermoanaerobaculia bacterium]|nr:twitch domain-containing radical SAM protein [Thermoanaerobaculia bacterium]
MSTSACVVPFTTLDISTDGTPLICCQAPIQLTVDGRPATMLRDPLEAIWNAPEIVEMRGAMARGERPDACRICWDHESTGPTSLRRMMNSGVQSQMGADWAFDALVRESARAGHILSGRPRWYQLQLGNTCNLKCRSCTPSSSSRIAADAVHRAWSATDFYQGAIPSAIPRAQAWYRDSSRLAQLFGDGGPTALSLLGGEPFLIEEVWELLRELAERGWSQRITLGLVTNGTRQRAELEQLAPAFQSVYVGVSMDGCGALFEYLRHGASWPELVRNIEWFQSLPNVTVGATPTLQNLNALHAVTIFRFLDERGINAQFNILRHPGRLAATNLPPRVRRIAAARLRAYLDEGVTRNQAIALSWAALLEDGADDFDPELFREFMAFTNDLDASRRESLADAEPELMALLRASGVRWTADRRHGQAQRPSTPLAPHAARGTMNRTLSA